MGYSKICLIITLLKLKRAYMKCILNRRKTNFSMLAMTKSGKSDVTQP